MWTQKSHLGQNSADLKPFGLISEPFAEASGKKEMHISTLSEFLFSFKTLFLSILFSFISGVEQIKRICLLMGRKLFFFNPGFPFSLRANKKKKLFPERTVVTRRDAQCRECAAAARAAPAPRCLL